MRWRRGLWQSPTSLHDKNPGESRNTEKYVNIIKSRSPQPTSCWKRKSQSIFSLKSGTRQGCPHLPIAVQYSTWCLSYSNKTSKGEKKNIGKEVKVFLFAYDVILYTKERIDSIMKLLQLMITFNTVAAYEINTQSQWHSNTQMTSKPRKKSRNHYNKPLPRKS